MTSTELRDRVTELRAWATSRIAFCLDIITTTQQRDNWIARRQEQITLTDVLRILDGKTPP